MPTDKKLQIVENVSQKFKDSDSVYFTNYTGMNVSQATKLRSSFRENSVDFIVAKNTLVKIAAKNAGLGEKFDDFLRGQIAIAYSSKDPTAPAKVIKEFLKENEGCLEVVGLYFEGEIYDPSKYNELANLPSKEELLSKLIGGFNYPMSNIVGLLNSSMSKVAALLNSLKNLKS